MQQATVKLFADMMVQPGTLQANLVAATASTGTTAPTSTITSPAPGTVLPAGTPVTTTGTATDAAGNLSGYSSVAEATTQTPPGAGPFLYFTTLQAVAVPGVAGPYNHADIYAYDGSVYSRTLAFVATMGFNGNVDALHVVDEDTFYLSFSNTTRTVPGVGTVQVEDVVLYDNGDWCLYFGGGTGWASFFSGAGLDTSDG